MKYDNKMITTLYISTRYLQCLVISIFTVLFFILLIDGSDQLNFFSINGLDIDDAVLNIFLRVPMLTMEAMGLIIMLSCILTFSWLSSSNEITILKASGKSAFRILFPLIMIIFVLGLLSTFIGGPLVSASMRASDTILERFNLTNKNSFSVSDNDIWLKDTNDDIDMVIKASQMNATATIFYDLIFFEFYNREELNRKIEATKAILKEGYWELSNVRVSKNDLSCCEGTTDEKINQLDIPTSLTNEQITDSFADPRVISIYSLKEFISRLETSGYTATRHKLFFLTELSRPFFFTAMLLISGMFLIGSESKFPRSVNIFFCLFLGFILFSIQKIFESFALTEQIPLALVAFGPSICAILIFMGIFLHIEDG
ncbi:LptF/LptG family permease [Paracoccaceae bacterium]|nr:LptF/LptG family permease [Paracoccaceae bacterium]